MDLFRVDPVCCLDGVWSEQLCRDSVEINLTRIFAYISKLRRIVLVRTEWWSVGPWPRVTGWFTSQPLNITYSLTPEDFGKALFTEWYGNQNSLLCEVCRWLSPDSAGAWNVMISSSSSSSFRVLGLSALSSSEWLYCVFVTFRFVLNGLATFRLNWVMHVMRI